MTFYQKIITRIEEKKPVFDCVTEFLELPEKTYVSNVMIMRGIYNFYLEENRKKGIRNDIEVFLVTGKLKTLFDEIFRVNSSGIKRLIKKRNKDMIEFDFATELCKIPSYPPYRITINQIREDYMGAFFRSTRWSVRKNYTIFIVCYGFQPLASKKNDQEYRKRSEKGVLPQTWKVFTDPFLYKEIAQFL